MHYGTPASIEEVLPYYTHIRRGRPPTQELLDDLVGRYQAIGGPSPLTRISQRQAELIHEGLTKRGIETTLYVGTKHTHPFVADTVKQMIADGVEEAMGIVLAPHFSTYSIAAYKHYAFGAVEETHSSMKLGMIERWGTMREFIDALSDRVKEQLEGWDLAETLVIFSAHSLPVKIMGTGDPYPEELMETSRLAAERANIPNWTFAFQSASTTGEPWLGPDILEVVEKTVEEGKYKNIVSCTVGFVSDHLEVLYDLGIETRDKCAELGINFRVARVLNEDVVVMDALAGLLAPGFAELETAPVEVSSH